MIKNIIWDVDGTLFDTYPAIAGAFRSAINDFGKDAPLEYIESLAKKSLGFCLSTLAEKYQLAEEEIDRKFGEHYALISPEDQSPFPGAETVCKYIITIGGKNVIVTHRGQQGNVELLAAHKLTDYFADCITGADAFPKKPAPAAFQAIMERQNLQREETIAVGDRDIDILAGQAAGVFTCLFGSEIEGVTADLTVGNFDELYRYLISVNSAQ